MTMAILAHFKGLMVADNCDIVNRRWLEDMANLEYFCVRNVYLQQI